jgi:hypothetical protein
MTDFILVISKWSAERTKNFQEFEKRVLAQRKSYLSFKSGNIVNGRWKYSLRIPWNKYSFFCGSTKENRWSID